MSDASEVMHRPRSKTSDALIWDLAGGQHRVVASRQLAEFGITPRAIARRVERRILHPKYRGVFAVGHPDLTRAGRWTAAVLAAGAGAALSHRSAAQLHGIVNGEG